MMRMHGIENSKLEIRCGLTPTATSKLLTQWQGVLKLVGKVNYQVDIHDRRKRKRIALVNMLHP